MAAGPKDTKITFRRATTAQDEYGEEISTWADLGQAFAEVFYGRGDERRQAAAINGQQPATFVVLSNSMTRSVEITDRIFGAGGDWDIAGIAPSKRPGDIEFTATRSV